MQTETVIRGIKHTDDNDLTLSVFFFDDGIALEEDTGHGITKISYQALDKIIKARNLHFDNDIRMQEALRNDKHF